MKTLKRHQRKLWVVPVLAVAAMLLVWALKPAQAQIMGDLPTVVLLPAVSMNSTLRLAGVYTSAEPIEEKVSFPMTPPVIEGRLLLIHPNGSFSVFGPFPINVSQNLKDAPNMFALHAEIKLESLNFFGAGDVGGAVLSLHTMNTQHRNGVARGFWTAGVYVEETSAVGTPLFSSYAAWLAEPRPDPISRIPQLP